MTKKIYAYATTDEIIKTFENETDYLQAVGMELPGTVKACATGKNEKQALEHLGEALAYVDIMTRCNNLRIKGLQREASLSE